MKTDILRRVRTILLCMVLLALPAIVHADGLRLQKSVFGSGKIVLSFAQEPLKTMTETPFSIELIGPSGKTITDAKLMISLDMPAMSMPPNHPKAPYEDNAYRGVAIFTMAGAWQFTINIQRPGYDQEQAVFDLEKVVMK
ncbi:MAG: FixH family protein [Deltaproteobacteria bacterium]|nr:FixH family protein [Deltaproteobacteria bacterium]MBW2518795.1 FixH family protein [Deltaproteobacteria bacterium]